MIDPRRGLKPNLDLLKAYAIYEKDYPLFLPDISATLAMNSPLFHRIDETLTEQSQLKAEYETDEARMRGAAMAGGVPLEQLRQMYRMYRESREAASQGASASAAGPSLNRGRAPSHRGRQRAVPGRGGTGS